MNIKRYQADNMQQAMAMVRTELGRDAVLISTKRVDGKVEVLATSEYELEQLQQRVMPTGAPAAPVKPAPVRELPFDLLADMNHVREELLQKEQEQERQIDSQSKSLREMQEEIGRLRMLFEGEMAQLSWRESRDRQPNRMTLMSRLEVIGINHQLATRLVDKVLPCEDLGHAWQRLNRMLLKALDKPAPDPLQDGGVIALVGSTGVGKTTTAVKLATRFAQCHGRNQVALITTDDYRAGQREQLLTLGCSLGLSVQVAASQQELRQAMDSLSDRKLLIIDTAGVNQRRPDFEAQFATFFEEDRDIAPYLVLSATVQESVNNETIRVYSKLHPVAAIVTKIDENASIGPVVSTLIRHQMPVAYVSTGQSIPGDLERASGEFFGKKIKESYRDSLAQMQHQKRRKAIA